MADQGSEDWLPAGWTVSVRLRRNGKKDKHYLGPCGQRFYSKVEVMRYLKNAECDPRQLRKAKAAIYEESMEDASACAVQKERPNSQEKEGSPESEEKYYSAEETVEDDCGHVIQSGSLNSEDKGNAKLEQPTEPCIYSKSGEDKALVVEEAAQNVCGSSMEAAEFNNEQSMANCSTLQAEEVKYVDAEESAGQIFGDAAENGSHQFKEENRIVEKNRTNTCDGVGRGCPKKRKKTRQKQSANVVVERAVAEGLPDGWIKEVKVTKKNNVVRKDPYYIDPVSGYIFRSMKDALRYLATGNIGRLAFKRKDIGDCDAALEDDKSFPSVETKRQKLHENGTNSRGKRSKQTGLHNSDEDQTTTMGQRSIKSTKVPDTECGSVTELGASDLPKLRSSVKNQERKHSNEIDSTVAGVPQDKHSSGMTGGMPAFADKALVPTDELPLENKEDTPAPAEVARAPQFEQLQENTEKTPAAAEETGVSRAEHVLQMTEKTAGPADKAGFLEDEHSSPRTEDASRDKTTPEGTPKSRKKKVLDLPRRTSNRLAGVSVDPGAEVTRTRAQRGTVRKSDEGEASGVKSFSARDCSQLQPQTKRTRRGRKLSEPMASLGPSEAALKDDAKKLERDCVDDEKRGKDALVAAQDNTVIANNAENPKADDESEKKPMFPFELPSGDILLDPCIEFAIKTLTGIDFDTSRSTPKSSSGSNSKRDATPWKVQAEHMGVEREVDKMQALTDKNASRAQNNEERVGADVPSSSLSDLPFGDLWQDPCIEFAIKTLTGAIPVEYNLDINDIMQQQVRSSQIQDSSEVALSNVGLDKFSRTDLLWQHFNDASPEMAAYRQHTEVVPIAKQHGNNMNLQRMRGAVLRQRLKNRGNKHQR